MGRAGGLGENDLGRELHPTWSCERTQIPLKLRHQPVSETTEENPGDGFYEQLCLLYTHATVWRPSDGF